MPIFRLVASKKRAEKDLQAALRDAEDKEAAAAEAIHAMRSNTQATMQEREKVKADYDKAYDEYLAAFEAATKADVAD